MLETDVYLAATLPSWKKRVCARCSSMHPSRLHASCEHCGQAWYCSPACMEQHWALGGSSSQYPVHRLC